MKKIILEEINRNREIMGLRPIMEQWEDNILKNLGLDAEKILAKAEADLLPVEKNLIGSIEKVAKMDTDKVLKSIEKGTLKDEFPLIAKKIEQELFNNSDKTIAKAALDSFYSKYPEATRIKSALDSDALKALIKKYEDSGMVKQAEDELAKIKTKLDSLPDGVFKDDLIKTFDSNYGRTISNSKISQQRILGEIENVKPEVNIELDKFGSGGLSKIYREKNASNFNLQKKRIKEAISKLESMAADPKLLEDFQALAQKVKDLDASAIEKAYYKVFGQWAEPLWAKSWWGKVSVVAILMSVAGTFGFTIDKLVDRCMPVIKQLADFLTINTSMCSTKKDEEGSGGTASGGGEQINDTNVDTVANVEEFVTWFNKTYDGTKIKLTKDNNNVITTEPNVTSDKDQISINVSKDKVIKYKKIGKDSYEQI
jgi:hypothetical protein